MKLLLRIFGIVFILLAVVLLAFRLSPWPSVLVIRRAFDKGAAEASLALEKHVPAGISDLRNEAYDPADPDGRLDVFFPSELNNSDRGLMTIVWIHGGAWISGTKNQIANYAKILASHGYTVVGVDYSVAPGKIYPTPVRQVNAALAYLAKYPQRLHVDPSRFVLAGDSGGAHIAAQVANVISVPSYASALGITPAIQRSQLRGVVLFCGPYDVENVRLDGAFGGFLRTVLWSYSGTKDFKANQQFATASVVKYVTPEFPPAFVSAGNADSLEPQSREFAEVLASRGVPVDTLFFPKDYAPPLAHEYQFNLDVTAGREALDRTVAFLSAR
jgi:acetyl esterase/lipase